MSNERENPEAGAPVEQAEATETQLLAAVERNSDVPTSDGPTNEAASEVGEAAAGGVAAGEAVAESALDGDAATDGAAAERPKIAAFLEPPSAAEPETAAEIFAANGAVAPVVEGVSAPSAVTGADVLPPAAPAPLPPVQDGEIRISADHPMAALYMQTPLPPEMKGNRGAGVLIALLATLSFAVVYAGILALWQAPHFPPSSFLDRGLLPWVLNWGFAAAVVGFFIGLSLLVLIFGKAGWWAYVIFGFVFAAFVWASTLLGYALTAHFAGEQVVWHPYTLAVEFGLLVPVIAAGVVAREVSVWFGAWIGARGRRIKRQNAEAVAEHEKALAEAQAN